MKVLLLGFSFKENCSDIRNSKIFNLYSNLKEKINKLDVYDPYVDKNEVLKTYNLKIININYKSTQLLHYSFLESIINCMNYGKKSIIIPNISCNISLNLSC